MKNRTINLKAGFTLIELMMVIAIIGVLSSIVVASFENARAMARDARRKVELRTLVAGLEIFYSQYGVYPCGDDMGGNRMVDSSLSYPFLEGDSKLNVSEQIGSVICQAPRKGLYTAGIVGTPTFADPINEVYKYFYSYEVSWDRQSYVLYARLERGPLASANDGGTCANIYETGPYVGRFAQLDIVSGGWYGISCN